jgi:hypothetical protein
MKEKPEPVLGTGFSHVFLIFSGIFRSFKLCGNKRIGLERKPGVCDVFPEILAGNDYSMIFRENETNKI